MAPILLLAACSRLDDPAGGDKARAIDWPPDVTVRVCADGGDHREIQDAIDASGPGDVIGVCAGTYAAIEIVGGQDVRLVSVDGAESTAIVGTGEPAVEVDEGTLELEGFSLKGDGIEDPYYPKAGGFSLYEGSASLKDSIVEESTGPFTLLFDEDYLVMDHVVFRDNDSRVLWYLWQGEDDNPDEPGYALITDSFVLGGEHETLLETHRLVDLTLRHTLFANVSIRGGHSAFILRRDDGGTLDVSNDVFYGIRDDDPAGGRTFEMDPGVVFRDNVVLDCDGSDLVDVDASYSIFWDNDADYAPWVHGEGNLFEDPVLADPFGLDFHLGAGSPAKDAGDPDPSMNDDDGTRNDIGLYGGPGPTLPDVLPSPSH